MDMISLQIQIFLLILLGFILARLNLIGKTLRGQLSSLVLKIFLPASIIRSFELDMSLDILLSCLKVLIASILIQVLYAVSIRLFWRNVKDEKKRTCLEYATMVSNAGFMGMPIAEAAFGAQGLLYASIFLIPQRIAMWSVGLSLFSKSASKKELVQKVLLHPCIVALGIGVVLMFFQMAGFHLPGPVDDALKSVGSCSTALSMIVIGAILADVPFREMLDKTCLLYSLVRTVVLPAIILACCLLAGFGSLAMAVCVCESAMPAPGTVVMLAESYDCDAPFASRLVFVSTVFSLFTLPCWMIFLQTMI